MELLFGPAQRTVFMRLSFHSRLFPGVVFTSGRRPVLGSIHTSINRDNAPLTLTSLGLTENGEVIREANGGKSRKQTMITRPPAAKARKQIDRKNAADVDSRAGVQEDSLFKKVKVMGASGERAARERKSKIGTPKRDIDIDAAIFSAKSFSELDLSPSLAKRLDDAGVVVPTEVQSTAIPMISRRHDVVIQSYTGSGKTFAYLLPILSEVGPLKRSVEGETLGSKSGVEAVIVAPSRELGMQIVREAERLLAPADKKCVQQLVGGANRSRQEEALKKNKPAIVVGTPGRIAEISAAGKLHTHGCRFLVLDEVDQLLSFTFREEMHRILEHVGRRRSGAPASDGPGQLAKRVERQLIMVSATVPFSVIRAARSWGADPLLVKAKSVVPLDAVSLTGPGLVTESGSASTSSSVTQAAVDSLPPALEHFYCIAKGQHKVDALRKCVNALDAKSVIVFMNQSKQLKDVVFKLEARGMKAAALHGDLGKLGRSTTLNNFKNGEIKVLVTNELSARGLDVFDCDLVVNLDLPTDSVHYAHRAGRTGRLGQKGTVVTICELSEVFVVKKLRRQLGVLIRACEFTDGELVLCKEEEEKVRVVEVTV